MTFLRAAIVGLAVVLFASACGGPSTQDDAAPFDAILIELFGTSDTERYLVEAERNAAEIVQTCMNDAGFEFEIPPTADTLEPPDPTSLDDAREVGFGIIADFRYQLLNAQVDYGLDPNVAYLSTLSRAEVQRFITTLDGVAAEPGQLKDNTGCNGQASDQAYWRWKNFSVALPNFSTLAEERDTHPDWIAARREWRDCMVDRGFDFAEPDRIKSNVISRMRDTVGETYQDGQLPLVEVDGDLVLDPQVDVLLEELAEFERSAAVANIECAEPLSDTFDAVERQVQQEFIDRNQATIDELIAANA